MCQLTMNVRKTSTTSMRVRNTIPQPRLRARRTATKKVQRRVTAIADTHPTRISCTRQDTGFA